MVLKPGETYPLHRHDHPYLSICLDPARLELIGSDGRTLRLTLRRGDFVWDRAPEIHAVRNVGRTKFRNRLIEVLG